VTDFLSQAPVLRMLLALLAAAVGSAMNSIAGGGTLVTFPAIVGLGIPPLIANATSTVALWPGIVGSLWGYRPALAGARQWIVRFTLPSLLGGVTGAWLLLETPPETFARIVPFLVLGATCLFMVQEPLMRRARARQAAAGNAAAVGTQALPVPLWVFLVGQFGVGIYGGYFGAAAGIIMLAILGFLGLTNIHQMNGLKNWCGLCMNAVAAAMFAASGIVNWPIALAMAVGGLLGGYAASRVAQRVGQKAVRRAIVAIGLGAFVWLLVRGG
jgi:uncharacterized membrane protein YfcA